MMKIYDMKMLSKLFLQHGAIFIMSEVKKKKKTFFNKKFVTLANQHDNTLINLDFDIKLF